MILNFPNIPFDDEEWIYILKYYLKGWTEISLTTNGGYDIDEIKFYDGLIGTLLKHTEKIGKEFPQYLNEKFVNSWKYQGKLYRVMHEVLTIDEDYNENVALPDIDYHRMITHWTDDFTFKALMHKLSPDEEYIILEADTAEHLAFNVNGFRKEYNCEELYTEAEREIIFPMYKECIKEYRMSILDFIKLKTQGML